MLFCGYCPWEGEWEAATQRLQPDLFVTAKYEAWPELWASLSKNHVPLWIVGARPRSSFKWARRVCRWLGVKEPQIHFKVFESRFQTELSKDFPSAQVELSSDPRWDRVFKRNEQVQAESRNDRFDRINKIKALLEPGKKLGLLGSVWPEDLAMWKAEIVSAVKNDQLVLVPHKVDDHFVKPMVEQLNRLGLKTVRLSQVTSAQSSQPLLDGQTVLMVDEIGYLSELYRLAGWAYVGGGFSEGVHSTIEPAIHGIPVAAGPMGAEMFSEIDYLLRAGQLTLVQQPEDLGRWLEKMRQSQNEQDNFREKWKRGLNELRGGSKQIAQQMAESLR